MSRRAKLVSLPLLVAAIIALSLAFARLVSVDVSPVLLGVFVVVVVAVVVLYCRMLVTVRRLTLLNQHGVALINQGRAGEALREFESCVSQARAARLTHYERAFQSNVAAALIELGGAEHAHVLVRSLLAESDLKRSLIASWGNFVGLVATILWMSKQAGPEEPRLFLDGHASDVPPPQQAWLITARVLVLLREERDADVDILLARRWLEAEGVLPARRLRRLALLWAFALHRAGRTGDSLGKLAAAGPNIAAEARSLIERWPDLAAFLSSRASESSRSTEGVEWGTGNIG